MTLKFKPDKDHLGTMDKISIEIGKIKPHLDIYYGHRKIFAKTVVLERNTTNIIGGPVYGDESKYHLEAHVLDKGDTKKYFNQKSVLPQEEERF